MNKFKFVVLLLVSSCWANLVYASASGTVSLGADVVLTGTDSFTINATRSGSSAGEISVDYIVAGAEVDNRQGTITWLDTDDGAPDTAVTITLESAGYSTITLFNPQGHNGAVAPTIDSTKGSMNLTYLPVLITGDSWTHWVDHTTAWHFYDDYLRADIEKLANSGTQGRSIAKPFYSTMHTLEEQIRAELDAAPRAKLVVVATAGGNDLLNRLTDSSFDETDPNAPDLWMDAIKRISNQIVERGAIPIWANLPVVPAFTEPFASDCLCYGDNWNSDFTALVLGDTDSQNAALDHIDGVNKRLLEYTQANGFGYIDLHDAFIEEVSPDHYDFKNDPVSGLPYNIQEDPLDPDDYEDQAHAYTVAGAELFADLVEAAIDVVVPNAQEDFSLSGTSFAVEEESEVQMEAVRTGDLTAAASVWGGFAGGTPITPPFLNHTWSAGEGGLATVPVNVGSVTADVETNVYMYDWGGINRGITGASLDIYNTDGPGTLSLTSDVIIGREEEDFFVTVERTDGQEGTAHVTYTISPSTALVDPLDAMGTISWAADERGSKTVAIPAAQIAAVVDGDEFAEVSLSAPSGSVGTPTLGLGKDTADIQIINHKVPGEISICADGAMGSTTTTDCDKDTGLLERNEGVTYLLRIRRLGLVDGTASTTVSTSVPIAGFPKTINWDDASPYHVADDPNTPYADGLYISSYPRAKSIPVPLPQVSQDTLMNIVFSTPTGSEGTPTVGRWGIQIMIKDVQ